MIVTATRWHGRAMRNAQPAPPRALLVAMLAEIEAAMQAAGVRPLGLRCVTWRRPPGVAAAVDNAALSMIEIEAAPGATTEPLRTWFAWRHPQWRWTDAPWPLSEGARA